MDKRVLLAMIEVVRNDLFAIPVHKEVDRTSWYGTCKCGSKALKKCSDSFELVDVPIDMQLNIAFW